MSADDIEGVADRLFAAIERGDVDAVAQLYAPDVAIWHNLTGHTQDRDENLKLLRAVTRRVKDLRYEEVRRERTASGFVQQHVLRGRNPAGKALEIPVCLVVAVTAGRITRIDEYLDGEALAPMFADAPAAEPRGT